MARAGAPQQQERFEQLQQADRERGFDFAHPPLMRLTLIRVEEDEHWLIWSHHHALLDGWSMPILVNEFSAVTALSRQGGSRSSAGAKVPGLHSVVAAAGPGQGGGVLAGATGRVFRADLVGIEPGCGRVEEGKRGIAEYSRVLSMEMGRLEGVAREHKLTPNTLMLGAWSLLLSRYSGRGDVLFGVTVAGRPTELKDVERRVGLYINTLPLRVEVEPSAPVLALLRQLHARQGELIEYQYTALGDVQRWSELGAGTSLFEVAFAFENYPVEGSEERLRQASVRIAGLGTIEHPHYLLTLRAVARDSRVAVNVIYDSGRLEPGTIERMTEHFDRLLAGIVSDPRRPLSELELLSEKERQRLLVEWNRTDREYPRDRGVHELFAEQAGRRPDAVAVICGEDSLSYGQLERRANQLAHHLRSLGVGPDVVVGLCVERSVQMVVGLLGILKAGGAYLPLDPQYPAERLRFMLADAQAPVLY